jgi:hypothetical protein
MVTSCMGTTQVCQESGNRPDRTSCGSGRACSGGTCITCNTTDYCGDNCTRCSTNVSNAVSACEEGRCIWRCREGYYRCGNRCVPAADVQPCPSGPNQVECRDAAGTCGTICAEDHHRCSDGGCYSNSDKARCGSDCNGCSAWNEECRNNRCCVTGGGPCF